MLGDLLGQITINQTPSTSFSSVGAVRHGRGVGEPTDPGELVQGTEVV